MYENFLKENFSDAEEFSTRIENVLNYEKTLVKQRYDYVEARMITLLRMHESTITLLNCMIMLKLKILTKFFEYQDEIYCRLNTV